MTEKKWEHHLAGLGKDTVDVNTVAAYIRMRGPQGLAKMTALHFAGVMVRSVAGTVQVGSTYLEWCNDGNGNLRFNWTG
jgi:hypothetical protein